MCVPVDRVQLTRPLWCVWLSGRSQDWSPVPFVCVMPLELRSSLIGFHADSIGR